MAENIPNSPAGAMPPRPSEAAKVQPKKETVRINLPPKPTAGPAIKIPTPAGAPPPPTPPAAAHAGAPAAAPVAAAPVAARPVAAAPAAPSAARPQVPARPVPAAAAATVGGLDLALGGMAALLALAALVRVFLLSSPPN